MKKTVFFIVILIFSLSSYSQNEEYERMAVNVVIPTETGLPPEVSNMLVNKMIQILNKYNVSCGGNERFVMTARIDVTNKDIAPTAPVKISQKMDITFIIGDIIDNKIYETLTIEALGIGDSETKSYIQAIKGIKPAGFQNFIEKAEKDIAEYYTNNCDRILKEASTLEKKNNYDAAILKLAGIPSMCEECFLKSQEILLRVCNKKDENDALTIIRKARSVWTVRKDYQSAEEAIQILSTMPTNTKCISQADELLSEINKVLRNKEAQAITAEKERWEFTKKQYEDERKAQEQIRKDRKELISKALDGISEISNTFIQSKINNITKW